MSDIAATPLVVGVDGSTSSVGAAQWAATIATMLGAPLHLVHSLPTTGHHISDAAVAAIRAAAPQQQTDPAVRVLTRAEGLLRKHHPDLPITTEAVWDSAGDSLVRASKGAQFVAVGCDEVNPAAALLVGATSLTVATRAACPVVVWRNVSKPDGKPIVVGVDGTPAGSRALATAFELAHQLGAPLRAVHAWTIKQQVDRTAIPYFVDWDEVAAAEAKFLDDELAPWQTRYPDVEVTRFVAQAKPAAALLNHGDGAQLVIVGNHWRSTIASVMLGSTALNLLHHSTIPVMICHAEDIDRWS